MQPNSFFLKDLDYANALSLNREYNRVVIAGRNVFKVFAIEENGFRDCFNLRVGKNLNLNFCCNDVTWSKNEDNIIATAATNGSVCVWNLNRISRSKQEHVFMKHTRTVNKVCFNFAEISWLLSGSQDGTMILFDMRTKEANLTFLSNSESVRDVQFSPHNSVIFAAVSDNGCVQIWDVRRGDKPTSQFTAHSGPIFSCDWHPEENGHLATASRDKTIKVWNLCSSRPVVEHTVYTIASVGRVKWRPGHRYHLASSSLVVDSSIHIWDIRRPYVPLYAFTEHKDVTTSVSWRGSPDLLISTSKDSTLMQHALKDAVLPSNSIKSAVCALSSNGDMFLSIHNNYNKSNYFVNATSTLLAFNKVVDVEVTNVITCAEKYLLSGKSLAVICEHNSNVASEIGLKSVSCLWKYVGIIYAMEVIVNECAFIKPDTQSKIEKLKKEENLVTADDFDVDDNFDDNSKLGDFHFGYSEMDPLNLEFDINAVEYDCLDQGDLQLELEAFPWRHEIHHRSPPKEEVITGANLEEDDDVIGCLSFVDTPSPTDPWDGTEILADALRRYAAECDVQTPVCILLVIGQVNRKRLFEYLDIGETEMWLRTYIELVKSWRLFTHAAFILKNCWLPFVSEMSQDSTLMMGKCAKCNKTLINNQPHCSNCKTLLICNICRQAVKGLFAWCQHCNHGGHINHIFDWFKNHGQCPAGCGHKCIYM